MTSATTMFATPLGRFLLCFAILLALLGLFEVVEYLASYSPLIVIALCLLVLCARRLGWLEPSLSTADHRPPFEDESRRSLEEPEGLAAPVEPLTTPRDERRPGHEFVLRRAELRRDLEADHAEIERRKASWEWAFAKWTADLPSVLAIGYQLVVFLTLGFTVGTGIVAGLSGLNLLLSFLIAEAIALIAFYVFRRMKRQSRNGGWN